MVDPDEILMGDPGNAEDEEREDSLIYDAVGEAIDAALGNGDVAHLDQFIKEFVLESGCGL